jgi:hypothetical protein
MVVQSVGRNKPELPSTTIAWQTQEMHKYFDRKTSNEEIPLEMKAR